MCISLAGNYELKMSRFWKRGVSLFASIGVVHPTPRNIFSDMPNHSSEESFQDILKNPKLKLERIVSKGHTSPENFWYDQDEDEWVIIFQGSAILEFETHKVNLTAGDHILIPKHVKHRVKWTNPDQETIWIALFF